MWLDRNMLCCNGPDRQAVWSIAFTTGPPTLLNAQNKDMVNLEEGQIHPIVSTFSMQDDGYGRRLL